jgi:hypothetical protein
MRQSLRENFTLTAGRPSLVVSFQLMLFLPSGQVASYSSQPRASVDRGLGNLNLSELQQYLQGINFPANKEEVAANAESNGALQDLEAEFGIDPY